MLTDSEIAAGTGRLTANKLKPADQKKLLGAFRLYLKNRAASFSDLPVRLAAAADTNDVKTASELAAIFIKLQEFGFGLGELRGGRSGLQTNKAGERNLIIRYGLTLLDYDLPEEFSGSLEAGKENIESPVLFPSFTVNRKAGW